MIWLIRAEVSFCNADAEQQRTHRQVLPLAILYLQAGAGVACLVLPQAGSPQVPHRRHPDDGREFSPPAEFRCSGTSLLFWTPARPKRRRWPWAASSQSDDVADLAADRSCRRDPCALIFRSKKGAELTKECIRILVSENLPLTNFYI